MSTKTGKKRSKQATTPPGALKASTEQTRRVALAQRRIGNCEVAVKQATDQLKRAHQMYDDAMRTE